MEFVYLNSKSEISLSKASLPVTNKPPTEKVQHQATRKARVSEKLPYQDGARVIDAKIALMCSPFYKCDEVRQRHS
jgi:hypothetical protein